MQSNTLIAMKQATLALYPHPYPEFKADPKNQVSIGDLHANALKLLHFLVFQNVFDMTEDDYYALRQIYLSNNNSKAEYKKFGEILDRVKVLPVGMVRLIGDELADRGQNDYFILKIIEKLGKSNVPFEILFSNHSAEFYGELTTQKYVVLPRYDSQRASLNNLLRLMENEILDEKEVREITEKYYFPNLKAVSYSIDDSTTPPMLTLYTHAPVGLETIQSLAKLYKVNYQDGTIEALCDTIDQINAEFRKSNPAVIMQQDVPQLVNKGCFNGKSVPPSYPLSRITWTRGEHHINLPLQQNGYALRLVHGHEGTYTSVQSYGRNLTSLDSSNLGKSSYYPTQHDLYYSLYSQDKITLKKINIVEKKKEEVSELISLENVVLTDKPVLAEKEKTEPVLEDKKPSKPASWNIPLVYWDRKKHPVIQERTKNALSVLKQLVESRETVRRLPWCSWFRDADSSGAEKMAKQLENGPVEAFNNEELIALRAEPLKQTTATLEKDQLLPEQFVRDESHPRRDCC